MIKKVLGFDVSSTCIGYCLLEWDDVLNTISYKEMNNYKPSKNGNILDRLKKTQDVIDKLIKDLSPDYIAIEDIIQFMPDKSKAITIITLAVFNRMIGILSYNHLKESPQLFNIMQIRHGLKIDNDLPKKQDMPELVAKHLGITFPYIYKKTGAVAPESEDMADGTAVALFYAFVLSGKIKLKIKKTKSKKRKAKVNES